MKKIPQEYRKFNLSASKVKCILEQTVAAFEEIDKAKCFPGESAKSTFLPDSAVKELNKVIVNKCSLVVIGENNSSKARLVNTLLGEDILPQKESSWRWISISGGVKEDGHFFLKKNGEVSEPKLLSTSDDKELYLRRCENEELGDELTPVVQIKLHHDLLMENVEFVLPPDICSWDILTFTNLLQQIKNKLLPLFIFVLQSNSLCPENVQNLQALKDVFPDLPICFILISGNKCTTLHSDLNLNIRKDSQVEPIFYDVCDGNAANHIDKHLIMLLQQLADLDCINVERDIKSKMAESYHVIYKCSSLKELETTDEFITFIRSCLQFYLIKSASMLNELLCQCLRSFILSAFDMAREIQITPRRIHYAQMKEAELYKNLMVIANEKQTEITSLIETVLDDMRTDLIEKAGEYSFQGLHLSENEVVESTHAVQVATSEVQYLVLSRLSNAVASQLVNSVDCLHETFVGTLQRCLESLERNCDQDDNLLASDAVKQILSAAYNVELKCGTTRASLFRTFFEKLKKFLNIQLPWMTPRRLDSSWRRRVATEVLESLNPAKLAKVICAQFHDRVKSSHESFQAAIKTLECHYSGHLERTEEQRVTIRKYHAPRIARLSLESTSLHDVVLYGMPVLGRELGRGQYGVVYSCESWGGPGPCAVKSVVPPDEKHWNDLAMEFYYTRTIPEHKNIVRLRGSVVDYAYGCGFRSESVLLVMDQYPRDLYCGLHCGLHWLTRLQIAIDVVEGIRFLHSQGLVHRDIKLKNVLLDKNDTAKITDLGFCIPEAMMSGSIVGTPIHMAPELLSGHYDSSVDVYAFGILFWYICAGTVKHPFVFEQFLNKEQLWTSVRKGVRPEKLNLFDERCWSLMQQCWSGEPTKRPLLGWVLLELQSILQYYASKKPCDDSD